MNPKGQDQEPSDPVIEAYKKDIDATLLAENLKLTHQERLEKLIAFMAFLGDIGKARERQP
ncbi:MAG TPA: hypothetical protein VFR10_14250 [bacterium]|nr:hypothetical protein [bacterium]